MGPKPIQIALLSSLYPAAATVQPPAPHPRRHGESRAPAGQGFCFPDAGLSLTPPHVVWTQHYKSGTGDMLAPHNGT